MKILNEEQGKKLLCELYWEALTSKISKSNEKLLSELVMKYGVPSVKLNQNNIKEAKFEELNEMNGYKVFTYEAVNIIIEPKNENNK